MFWIQYWKRQWSEPCIKNRTLWGADIAFVFLIWQNGKSSPNGATYPQYCRYQGISLMRTTTYQRLGRNMAVLIHAANSLPACKRAILHPNSPMTPAVANCCNLANTSSLLANSNLRKILEWPICHSASDKLSLFDNTCARCLIPLPFFVSSIKRKKCGIVCESFRDLLG